MPVHVKMESDLTTTCTTMAEEPWTTITTTSTRLETITTYKNETSTLILSDPTKYSPMTDAKTTSIPIYSQGKSSKSMPLVGLNSASGRGTVTNSTDYVTLLPNNTSVSSFPSLIVSGSSFSTGMNATMKWAAMPNRTDLGTPPNPTSALISLGIKNKSCILMVAIISVIKLAI